MPDPLVAVFTEALSAPAGPIPAGFAEDYATELAKLARSVLAQEAPKPFARILRYQDGTIDEVAATGTVHIEQMDIGAYCLIINQGAGQWIGNLTAYEAETGAVTPPPARNGLDAMIDEATGVTEAYIMGFAHWAYAALWGDDETPNA